MSCARDAFAIAAATRCACSAVGEPSVAQMIFVYGMARLPWSEYRAYRRPRTYASGSREQATGRKRHDHSVRLPAPLRPGLSGFRLCRIQLGFDLERDLLADDHAARFQSCVPRHAPVFAVDLRRGAEARNRGSPRRALDALELDLQLDRARLVADREVACDVQAGRTRLLHGRATERDRRILLDVEEVRGPKVIVSLLVAREDARRIERHLDAGGLGRRADLDLAGKPVEVTADLRHHHVARDERSPRVARVQRPRAGGRSRDFADLPDLAAKRCL